MTIPTKTSKSELRKKPSKAKQTDLISEKASKKAKALSSAKAVSSKKVKHQPKETDVEKIPKKKTRSSDAIAINKKASLKKVNSSTELKHKSSSPSLPTKNATKKSKQTNSHKQAIKSTVEKKSTKKLKKQSSAHTLSSPPPPPPSTPIPAKRPPLKQCVSVATSTSIGVDMSTQTDPIVETQLFKPLHQSHYLDVRDLVPVNALKFTLEELMGSMQIVEKQRAVVPIKKQATIKSKLRKALKSIKI
ncbi:hypothetical protein MBANPS3_010909 [Mucor bainieri]